MKSAIKTIKNIAIFIAVLAAASSAHAQVCTPAPVGLVSWYAADGNALDSRSRNNGTLQNGATFGAGKVGQAFNFDGVDDWVRVNDAAPFYPGTGSFTIDAWVRTSDANLR